MSTQQKTKILVIGDDLGAMILAWHLSGQAGIDATIVMPNADLESLPAVSGPALPIADTPQLRECLEYFELPSSEYSARRYAQLGDKLIPTGSIIYKEQFAGDIWLWENRARAELHSPVKDARRFSEIELARALFEYLSPEIGKLVGINADDRDVCIQTGADAFACIEYDQLVLECQWYQARDRGPLAIVRGRELSADFDVLCRLDPDAAISRITFRAGAFICEAFPDAEHEDALADVAKIFGDAAMIDEWVRRPDPAHAFVTGDL